MNKIFNKLTALFVVSLIVTALSSCKENFGEPDLFLDVTTADINVDFSGKNSQGELPYIEVGSNTSWQISSKPDWIKPSIMESERGRFNVYINCDENISGADRDGNIVFTGAGQDVAVKIKQSLKTDILSLSETSFNVGADGKLPTGIAPSFYILDVNSSWSIEKPEWINLSQSSGEAGQYIEIILDVEPNSGSNSRIGKLIVKAGVSTAEISVQQAVDGIDLGLTTVSVNNIGNDENGNSVTFKVTTTTTWTATSGNDWITVSPSNGSVGTTDVTLTFTKNTTDNLRSGEINFTTKSGKSTLLTVTQSSTPYIDNNTFFKDDFSWLSPYIAEYNSKSEKPIGDSVENDDASANAPNMYSTDPFNTKALKEFSERGYVDLLFNKNKNQALYVQDAYLKFGKTGYHTGIALPKIEVGTNATDVDLVFDWSAHMTGSGNIDKLTLTVEVENGGTVLTAMPIHPEQEKGDLKWQKKTVRIQGLTAESIIKIRPTQMDLGKDEQPDQQRWHIDNIQVLRVLK